MGQGVERDALRKGDAVNRFHNRFPGLLGEAFAELGAQLEEQRVVSSPSVSVLERGTGGTKLGAKLPPPIPVPPRQRWFQVREVLHDFMLCHPLDSRLWVEYGLDPASYILVAKPLPLRTYWLTAASGSQGGFTFEKYVTEEKQHRYRQHGGYSPEKDLEEIYPFYTVGDLFLAQEIRDDPPLEWNLLGVDTYTALGLVTPADITPSVAPTDILPAGTQVKWLDLNHEARRWASLGLLTGDRLASGDVTINVGGTPYTDANSIRVIGYEL